MKVTGVYHCAGCGRNLSKNLLAAYGMDEVAFNCPSCATTYTLETKHTEGNEREFIVHRDAGFQLVVMAVIGNPHDSKQGFQIVPITVPLKNKIQPGLHPFDHFDGYRELLEATFEELLIGKFSTVYGVGSFPVLRCIFPEEVYYQLGHPNAVKFFDKMRDASGLLSQWVKMVMKKGTLNATMSAGTSLAYSMLSSSPYIANYIDGLLENNMALVFEEGVLQGISYSGATLRTADLKLPGKTTPELMKMIAVDHKDYLDKFRETLNAQKGKKK